MLVQAMIEERTRTHFTQQHFITQSQRGQFPTHDSFIIAAFISTGRINTSFVRSTLDRPESITLTSDTGNTAVMNVILSCLFCALENQLKY